MKELIRLLNQMLSSGIVSDYVIGEATALIYYCEPFQTQDVDVFVLLKKEKTVISFSEIYDFLEKHGGEVKGEYVIIHGVPAQFLVPYNPLVEDAVKNGIQVDFNDVPIKIMSLEHLMAIMVQTGRGKDKTRLEEIETMQIKYDRKKFAALLKQHGLQSKWDQTKENFGP